MPLKLTRGACSALAILALGAMTQAALADTVTVFAAASTKNAMDEIAQKYQEDTGNDLQVSLAGSSALARQIQQGAPADIFLSANVGWMDALEEDGLIVPESRSDLLTNSIVLVSSEGGDPVTISPELDLAGMLGEGHLAMALVEAVPAGIYGKASLQALGMWEEIEPKVAQADNVRAALALVSSGEAPLGIVYSTDAVADANVSVLGTFPAASHPPIIYPVAAIRESDNPLNAAFLAYLRGPVGTEAFERQGFGIAGAE